MSSRISFNEVSLSVYGVRVVADGCGVATPKLHGYVEDTKVFLEQSGERLVIRSVLPSHSIVQY